MITENLSTLKINKLSQAQYDREEINGSIDINALYLTPYEEVNDLVVSSTEPTNKNVQIWVNPNDEIITSIPEIKDNIISETDTWSSSKINNKIENMQMKLDELNPSTQSLIDLIYPVGSIYMSVNATNPSDLFGGTWERWGSGRTPVGVDVNDSDFASSELTGGEKVHVLTSDELASHAHSIPAHAHGLNSHTHSVGAHAHGLNSHTHSVPAHAHGLNSHTHSIPALSGTAASNGAHTHKYGFIDNNGGSGTARNGTANVTDYSQYATSSAGAHTHSVTTTANTSGAASGSTANNTAFNSGGASGNTANSSALTSGAASGNTANSTAVDSGATGSGTAHNNLQPYITCYMWKRTA